MSDNNIEDKESEKIEAIITEEVKPKLQAQIQDVEEEVLDKVIESKKPKKERSEKQKIAFEKARITRAENIKKRKEEVDKNRRTG